MMKGGKQDREERKHPY